MIEVVLTDVEGTTSSLASVHRVLVPYARPRLGELVRSRGRNPEIREALEAARTLASAPNATDEELVRVLEAWSDEDRKAPPLKVLQGLIWEEGYRRAELRSHVYPDVPPALREWHARGLRLAVFSSGSVRAQKLFFEHTNAGDLRALFSAHFDTAVGAKGDPAAYAAIARTLGTAPSSILFLSDVRAELDAARNAGLATVGVAREGAAALGDHPVTARFDAIDVDSTPPEVVAAGTRGARIAELARYLHGRGLCVATSGNFSARLSDERMAITASGRDKASLTAEDVLVADLAGRSLVPTLRPSAEAALHAALYRTRPSVGAVAHTHSVAATVLSRRHAEAGALRLEGYEMGKALSGVTTHEHAIVLPIVANSQDVPALAHAVDERLRQEPMAPGYLVAGHGLTTWGADLAEVRRHVEGLEFLLACALAEGRGGA